MKPFRTALLAASLVLPGTLASADTCSDVDFRTIRVIEQVFSVPASDLSPGAEYLGKLAITDAKRDQLVSALQNEFGIQKSQLNGGAGWRRIQDTIAEIRRITKCSG